MNSFSAFYFCLRVTFPILFHYVFLSNSVSLFIINSVSTYLNYKSKAVVFSAFLLLRAGLVECANFPLIKKQLHGLLKPHSSVVTWLRLWSWLLDENLITRGAFSLPVHRRNAKSLQTASRFSDWKKRHFVTTRRNVFHTIQRTNTFRKKICIT